MPADSSSGEGLSSWLVDSSLLTVFLHGLSSVCTHRGKKSQLPSVSFYKDTNPSKSVPHLH